MDRDSRPTLEGGDQEQVARPVLQDFDVESVLGKDPWLAFDEALRKLKELNEAVRWTMGGMERLTTDFGRQRGQVEWLLSSIKRQRRTVLKIKSQLSARTPV